MVEFTNVKEGGLESIIVDYLRDNNKYVQRNPNDYNRNFCVDIDAVLNFIKNTQEKKFFQLGLDTPNGQKTFFTVLKNHIDKNGVIDVIRNGAKISPVGTVDFYYPTPSEGNEKAKELYEKNIFSVIRQVQYAKDESLALDFVVFLNGLPLFTFELKNNYTKQNVKDAIKQYQTDRDPKEPLFRFGRCVAHFAVDDELVYMCTKLDGKSSWFLPFNKGNNGGAGNPVNPNGIKTDYLWKEILTKESLSNILENYAQIIEEKDKKTGKVKYNQIFPRYHQLKCVTRLLEATKNQEIGSRFLIQHSAGSGKSNSISWLAHQLVSLEKDGKTIFDSVIVVSDRKNIDKQLKNSIKHFAQVKNMFAHANSSSDLSGLLDSGKKIIISTVHKFGYILNEISKSHKNNKYAIIIDEAHSSQGGTMASKMNVALTFNPDEIEDNEDLIGELVRSKLMNKNANYYAFTATPKPKTLELFGTRRQGEDGADPFDIYTMKQAIEEGFILDVLKNYTSARSYYKLVKTIADNPMYDKEKAQRKLKHFVEGNEYPISVKARIIADHFITSVIRQNKINGKARAMVVCDGVLRAIEYFKEITKALEEFNSPYKCIIAFSEEKEYNGKKVNEAFFNEFPSNEIEDRIEEDPYRILVVADKFQTGYDQPLLYAMYVDKPLTDIKAVQTLSRLNRACPGKTDTFVLDFYNDPEDIRLAFQKYYKGVSINGTTDPQKLYEIQDKLEKANVFTQEDVDSVVNIILSGGSRELIDPIINSCVEEYVNELDENAKIDFKGACRSFIRTYNFLSAILPLGNVEWEKLCTFLSLLVTKLPSPDDGDDTAGLLENVDLDSYRIQIQTTTSISLEDKDTEMNPQSTKTGGGIHEVELDYLDAILEEFHSVWGNIEWTNEDQVKNQIKTISDIVSQNEAYQNAMANSDKQNASIECAKALKQTMLDIMTDNIELYKQFSENPDFAKWLINIIFAATYNQPRK